MAEWYQGGGSLVVGGVEGPSEGESKVLEERMGGEDYKQLGQG